MGAIRLDITEGQALGLLRLLRVQFPATEELCGTKWGPLIRKLEGRLDDTNTADIPRTILYPTD